MNKRSMHDIVGMGHWMDVHLVPDEVLFFGRLLVLMLRSSDTINAPIMINGKDSNERVVDWVIDVEANLLIGFLTQLGGLFGGARVLPWDNIATVSPYAISAKSDSPILEMGQMMEMKKVLESQRPFVGHDLVSQYGKHIGKIIDFYFDETSGIICGLDVSAVAKSTPYLFVPVQAPLHIPNGFVVATADMLSAMAPSFLAQHNGHSNTPIGQRLKRDLRDVSGLIIGARGQIITETLIQAVRDAQCDDALSDAV